MYYANKEDKVFPRQFIFSNQKVSIIRYCTVEPSHPYRNSLRDRINENAIRNLRGTATLIVSLLIS